MYRRKERFFPHFISPGFQLLVVHFGKIGTFRNYSLAIYSAHLLLKMNKNTFVDFKIQSPVFLLFHS